MTVLDHDSEFGADFHPSGKYRKEWIDVIIRVKVGDGWAKRVGSERVVWMEKLCLGEDAGVGVGEYSVRQEGQRMNCPHKESRHYT